MDWKSLPESDNVEDRRDGRPARQPTMRELTEQAECDRQLRLQNTDPSLPHALGVDDVPRYRTGSFDPWGMAALLWIIKMAGRAFVAWSSRTPKGN
jgi:hypothetical protein